MSFSSRDVLTRLRAEETGQRSANWVVSLVNRVEQPLDLLVGDRGRHRRAGHMRRNLCGLKNGQRTSSKRGTRSWNFAFVLSRVVAAYGQ